MMLIRCRAPSISETDIESRVRNSPSSHGRAAKRPTTSRRGTLEIFRTAWRYATRSLDRGELNFRQLPVPGHQRILGNITHKLGRPRNPQATSARRTGTLACGASAAILRRRERAEIRTVQPASLTATWRSVTLNWNRNKLIKSTNDEGNVRDWWTVSYCYLKWKRSIHENDPSRRFSSFVITRSHVVTNMK